MEDSWAGPAAGFSTEQCAAWLAHAPEISNDQALESAAMSFIDTVAAMAAGWDSEAASRTLATIEAFANGRATVVGRRVTMAPLWAAMINGVAAHAAELDDNFLVAGTHGSAVLFPALMAVAEQEASNGRALLDAYIAGLQVQWRLSQSANPAHGALGWHPTSTLGVVGAAAACARLLKLNVAQITHGLAISASMMSGTNAQFGTMTKPLHSGFAAHRGLFAALLARSGVTGGSRALESEDGSLALMGARPGEAPLPATFGEPLAFHDYGVAMKLWPTCGSSHPPVWAALQALAGRKFNEITSVEITIPNILNNNLKYSTPTNADEAKFSLEFAVASALLDGTLTLASLGDDNRNRPGLHEIASRIRRRVLSAPTPDFSVTAKITFHDGACTQATCSFDDLPGTRRHPLSLLDLASKLEDCARGRLSREAARDIANRLLELASGASFASVSPLLRL